MKSMSLNNEKLRSYSNIVKIINGLLHVDDNVYSIRNIDKIEAIKSIDKRITEYKGFKDRYIQKDVVEARSGMHTKKITVPDFKSTTIEVGMSFNIYFGEHWVPLYFKDKEDAVKFRNELIAVKGKIESN
jgi:hypothetical protein